jgi:cytochrome c553
MSSASFPDPTPRPPLARRALRVLGIGLGALLALLVVAVAGVYAATELRFRRTYDVDPAPRAVHVDAALVREGKRLAVARGCTDCHGADLSGKVMIDAPPLGRIVTTNLTKGRGGIGARYTPVDFDRAIRHGVGPDHRPLLLMPSHEMQGMRDEELAALTAYLGTLPAVDTDHPGSYVGPVGRALLLMDRLPLLAAEKIDHAHPKRAPAPGATPEYGAYLAAGCTGCHGASLSGGTIPGAPAGMPAGANLTPHTDGLGRWTQADFIRAMRTGRRPDGRVLNEAMPWKSFREMNDEELAAIWAYLHTLPPRAG